MGDKKVGLDDYLLNHSAEEFLKLPAIEIKSLIDRIGDANGDNYKWLLKEIGTIDNDIEIERLCRLLGKKINVDYRTIKKEVKTYKTTKTDGTGINEQGLLLMDMCQLDYEPEIPDRFSTTKDGHLIITTLIKDMTLDTYISKAFGINALISGNNSQLMLKTLGGKKKIIDMAISDTRELDREISSFLEHPHDKDTLKLIQKYISGFYALNKVKMIKLKGLIETGWVDNVFYHPARSFSNVVWENDTIVKSLTSGGNRDLQFNMVQKMLNTQAGICIVAGLSATLLRLLGIPNFILNLTGLPKMGKSSAALFNASLWGNPSYLRGSWFATKVGFEIFASMWRDMPVWLDEFESGGKDVSAIIDFMYQYHQGFGKLRGTKNLKIRSVSEFSGVLITTSEKDIDSIVSQIKGIRSVPRGLFRRVIEVPIDENSFKFFNSINRYIDLPELNKFSYKNYGWFAVEWVEWAEKNINKVKEIYNQVYTEVSERGNIKGMESSISSILTVTLILEDVMDIEIDNLRKWIVNDLLGVQRIALNKTTNIVGEFKEALTDLVMTNKDKFVGLTNDEYIKSLWGHVFENGSVFMLPTVFKNEICLKHGFIKSQILTELAKQNSLYSPYLKSSDSRFQYKHRLFDRSIWGYFFKNIFSNVSENNSGTSGTSGNEGHEMGLYDENREQSDDF